MNNIFVFVISVLLFFQVCDSPANVETRESSNLNVRRQDVDSMESNLEKCDFSEFAPVRIFHFDSETVIKEVIPEYPIDAKNRGVEGNVVVRVLIDENGDVNKACIVKGEPELRYSAETAARQWKFKPKYGIAFTRPITPTNPQNYAEILLVFTFKKSGTISSGTDTTETNVRKDKEQCDFSSYKPIQVSHFVSTSLKEKFAPEYPQTAVQRNAQGIVSVKILVDRDGTVVKACALDGDEELARVAEEAALKWKFKRNVVPGRQSFVQDGISFRFVLDKTDDDIEKSEETVVYPGRV
jgi:TonB family protein